MATEAHRRLILASGSRGRRELMEKHGYAFDVRVSNIHEPTEARLGDCRHYVAELAWLKAEAVAASTASGIIIAADTVGWQYGKVVGKPDDRDHARRIITALSGTTHDLWTGICLWVQPEGWQFTWQELSVVEMQSLGEAQIEAYLDTRLWEGCSGAYAIQQPTDPYLRVVRGSISNVIGLPMESLSKYLASIHTLVANDG